MWIARELVRLAARVALCFVFALVLAVLLAAIGGSNFEDNLRMATLAVGCLALLAGGVGQGSNFERAMDAGVTNEFWGRVPGWSSLRRQEGDRTLAPGAIFFLTGGALLALGLFAL